MKQTARARPGGRRALSFAATQSRSAGWPRSQSGLTIVESALVLLVIGLLFAGAVLGQNLIANGQAREVIASHDGQRAAILAFQDRFRSLPGDYLEAVANIPRVQHSGNGNGRVENNAAPLAPTGVAAEDILAWDHLSKAHFIQGAYEFNAIPSAATLPRNRYGGFVDLAYDTAYATASGTAPQHHTLKTGNQIPVELLAQVDQKIDDGAALTGSFRFSEYARSGSAPLAPGSGGACVNGSGRWDTTAPALSMNCGAASLL